MRGKKFPLLFLVALIFFSSCQKEVDFLDLGGGPGPGTGNTGAIIGDYNFVGLWSKQNNSVTTTQAGMELKAVALTEYTSQDNIGSLKITNDKFLFTGIGHKVQGTAIVLSYLDGVLIQQTSNPYEHVTPPADQSYDYVRNNSDSITFINGFANLPDASPGGTPTLPTGPIGARISFSSDTLVLYTKFDFTFNQNQAGVPVVMDVNVEGIMKFKKK